MTKEVVVSMMGRDERLSRGAEGKFLEFDASSGDRGN